MPRASGGRLIVVRRLRTKAMHTTFCNRSDSNLQSADSQAQSSTTTTLRYYTTPLHTTTCTEQHYHYTTPLHYATTHYIRLTESLTLHYAITNATVVAGREKVD